MEIRCAEHGGGGMKTLIPAFSHERRARRGEKRLWALAGEGGGLLARGVELEGARSYWQV